MVDQVPEQSTPTSTVGRPRVLPGTKLANSPHRDDVVAMLLSGKGFAYVKRFLEEKGEKVNVRTIKSFKDSFVESMDAELKGKILSALYVKEKQKDAEIINTVAHHKLTEVDSTIELLKACELQVARLNARAVLGPFDLSSLGQYIDRIKFLRGHLAKLQVDSEVELAIDHTIKDICDLVFAVFKNYPDQVKEFIDKVCVYKEQRYSPIIEGQIVEETNSKPT